MKKGFGLIIIIVLLGIAIGATVYYFVRRSSEQGLIPTPVETYGYPTPANTYATPTASSTDVSNMIKATSPLPNALVKSPLTVTGEARGNWYFEASFPVRILDAGGKVLGQMPAQAQGEWMTTSFVPFRISLSFATSTTATGTLVLEKDNPSGLPQNAAELRIPIRFR